MIGYPSSTLLLEVLDSVSKKARTARTARTTTRFGITFIVALMVMSSPIVLFINPALVLAAGSPAYMMSTPTPSTISQDGGGDFTAQASLAFRSTKQTNNIVNTQSEFAVIFSTGATGVIKTITVTFPAGTIIGSGNLLFDREGIGPGSATRTSSTTITYTVNNAVSVPAGTKIKLEFATIINAPTPGNHQVIVTTRTAANSVIDGPSAIGYTLKQIGPNDIADGAITATKPAESFMKRVTLPDNAASNALGWNPNGATLSFTISEPTVSGEVQTFVSIYIESSANHFCDVTDISLSQTFTVRCSTAPPESARLEYVVETLPPHIVA